MRVRIPKRVAVCCLCALLSILPLMFINVQKHSSPLPSSGDVIRSDDVIMPEDNDGDHLLRFTSPYIRDHDEETEAAAQKGSAKRSGNNGKRSERTKTVAWFGEGFRERFKDDHPFERCPVSDCSFLASEDASKADAVLFRGVDGREMPPPRSHARQVYVLYDMEPPMHVTEKYWTDEWNGVFNWTWNFRRDADIWEPTNYLRPTKSPPPKTFFLELAEKKSKPVAWFVSDCGAVSRRDDYARELQRHIAVDVFGSCGNLSCPRLPQEICFNMLTEQYFFYLSFENALCRDYVTEKFFNKFTPGVHVLPIVLGGANYSQFFPKGSFIDVAWFAHPKDLAQYMKNLMTDKATYAELLWRKAHLQKSGRGSQAAVCELCKRLHDLDTYGKRYDNIKTWRFDGQCFPPEWF